jgi:hypothetical protein
MPDLGMQTRLLIESGVNLSRPELLVAWYELVSDFRAEIVNATSLPKNADQLNRYWSLLLDPLSQTGLDLLSVEPAFWLAVDRCRERPALLARAALGALDESMAPLADLRFPAATVGGSFFHQNKFWVVPRRRGTQLAWTDADPPSTSGLRPLRWLPHTAIIPQRVSGAAIRSAALPSELDRWLEAAGTTDGANSLRLMISPLARVIEHQVEPVGPLTLEGGTHSGYRLSSQKDVQRLTALLSERVLPACETADAAILVLPELTISPELRGQLRSLLRAREELRVRSFPARAPRPILVVAGSYHEHTDEGYVNRSLVLDHTGRVVPLRLADGATADPPVWQHDKVARFRLDPGAFGELDPETRAAWLRQLGMDQPDVRGGAEPYLLGQQFTIVSSSLGRVCVAICIDFLDYCKAWVDPVGGAWLDLILVPAATIRWNDFADKARDLAINGTGSLIVNACWFPEALQLWKEGANGQWAGLAHMPGDLGRWTVLPDAGRRRQRTVPPVSPCRFHRCTADGQEGCYFVFEVPQVQAP